MRYLPLNNKDTYNYTNPSVADKVKKFFKNFFTIELLIMSIFYIIVIGLIIAILAVILPLLLGYYTLIVIAILALLGAKI